MTLASYHLLQYSETILYINDLQTTVNTEKHRFSWYYPPSNVKKTPKNCHVLEIWHTESTK